MASLPRPNAPTLALQLGQTVVGDSADCIDPAGEAVLGRGAAIGRYLVLSLLGRGGMGEVYAAYDPELDRRVAVKLLHTARGTEQARRRLLREARALGRLSHPNVVQVYDVGEHGGDVFVTMELVDGDPLSAWCQGPPRPGWRDVLAAYADAARGLAAAHEKGIVHRDVKPANILRGKDGRVRVADFGLAARGGAETPPRQGQPAIDDEGLTSTEGALPPLDGGARPEDETIPAPADSDGEHDDRLTATGALLGTPLYMAPEQFEGRGVGPASDQFGLCAALYEGLYGDRPFRVEDGPGKLLHYLERKKEGPPPAPPGTEVPSWVYAVVARGLAPRPEDRFPSMADLAAALARDPEARPRSPWRTAALAALAVAIAGVVAVRGGALADPCAHRERQLAGAWDESARRGVRTALLGTGRSYAEDTAGRVERVLDAYTASWTTMRGEVCQASRTGSQRRELTTLRDECLDRRLGQVRALTTLLAEKADAHVLDRAVQAATSLPPVADCADTEALTARVRPPEGPALRAKVAEVTPQIDRLEALFRAGKYAEGVASAEPVLAAAASVAHAPTQARAQLWVGNLRAATGDYERAKASLREAARLGAEGKDDVLVAAAWARVLFVLGEGQRHLEEAADVDTFGPTLLALAHDPPTEVAWLNAEGQYLTRRGRYEEAKAAFDRAISVGEKTFGPDSLDNSTPLNSLGILLVEMGEPAKAKAAYERALALREQALGPEHPAVATAINNLGMALSAMGDMAGALAAYQRALALWERSLGPDHPHVAQALNNVGGALAETGALEQARAAFQRSLAIREKALGPDHPDVAQSLYGVGRVLRELDDLEGSRAALERARAISEKALGPDHPDVAYSLAGLGRTLVRLGRLDEAERVLTRALSLREPPGKPASAAATEPLLGLGELNLARGKPEEAASFLERALKAGDPEGDLEVRLALAEALWKIGKDRPRARALVEEARARRVKLGDPRGTERAARWLAGHPG